MPFMSPLAGEPHNAVFPVKLVGFLKIISKKKIVVLLSSMLAAGNRREEIELGHGRLSKQTLTTLELVYNLLLPNLKVLN